MQILRFVGVFALYFSLLAPPVYAAVCDPASLQACQQWAQEQVEALGCRVSQPAFNEAIEDLYLGKGCRMQGSKWLDLQTGATVSGRVAGGINTDTNGCIERYTPTSYLSTGGYFRTPKEALNGSLRNKSISGCEFNGDSGKKDASTLTPPIIEGVESCACAESATNQPVVTVGGGGGSETKEPETSPCSENKVLKDGECVCQSGFAELDDLSCARQCDASKHLTRKTKTECGCTQLYRLDKETQECVFSSEKGFLFDSETREAFQEAVEGLAPDQGTVFEGTLSNGKKFRIAILKLSDGSYIFSNDGRHYVDAPEKAIKPGLISRSLNTLDNVLRTVKGWFGIGKFTGRNTQGDAESQEDQQTRYEASTETLKGLQSSVDDADLRYDAANDITERWLNRAKNPLTGKWDDQFLEELKNGTGIDVPMIKKILTKDLAGIGEDVIKKLTTFPADAVVVLAQELRSDSFDEAVKLYMKERAAKKSPSDIASLLIRGDLPELDFATSIEGVGKLYAQESLLSAYEQAYQRYLISKQFKAR